MRPNDDQDEHLLDGGDEAGPMVDRALNIAGGNHRFQRRAAVVMGLVGMSCAVVVDSVYFLTSYPAFQCREEGEEGKWKACTREDACFSSPDGFTFDEADARIDASECVRSATDDWLKDSGGMPSLSEDSFCACW